MAAKATLDVIQKVMQQASRTFQETVAVIGTAGSSALSSYPARSANISKPPPSQWKREHLLKNYSCKSIQKNVKRCTSIVHHQMYSVSKVEIQKNSNKNDKLKVHKALEDNFVLQCTCIWNLLFSYEFVHPSVSRKPACALNLDRATTI